MSVQRMTIVEGEQHKILLEDAWALPTFPFGTLKKTLSEWESQINWGHLSLKCPTQATTPENLSRDLVMASSSFFPPVLVTESSFEEEDLSPRSRNWSQKYKKMEIMLKKEKMLRAGELVFFGEIVVVEECIPVEELNWNMARKRWRPRRRELQ
ncbi:hypothetical protein AMTR_s00005p00155670 [Amborella trichopoda]|uniref:Uncharacterized protein n=1 Tax=Amborella trichopoda TaxID=13333 RepID=W1PGE9_AMBTC|nr:hypothetical protein AMTR_s00005p00155670 [Amborella trichopoda]